MRSRWALACRLLAAFLASLMAEPHLPLLSGLWPLQSPNTELRRLVSPWALCVQPSGGHFKPGSPPGPPALAHPLSLAPWFAHFRGRAARLFPRALMPGCPCKGGGLSVFINKAFALSHWQSRRRARRASVSKLEFGLGSPM